jgi:hypothetical protein
MHPPFKRLGVLVARKNVGFRPRLRWTDGDRWVSLPTEPSHYIRSGPASTADERREPDPQWWAEAG